MSHGNSKSAVLMALGSNATIAISKFVAAFWTSSGAMMAEAIHSSADCLNQIFLLIGMKRAEMPDCKQHPLGHGREVFFWSLMVAMLLFFVGGAYSIMEGYHRLMNPEPLEHATIAVVILVIAVILEGLSLKGALKALKPERGNDSLFAWAKKTKDTNLLIVTGEDIAALAGLILALVAVGLTVLTGNPMFDALGSMVIGGLLVAMAVTLTKELHSLSIGESAGDAYDEVVRSVCRNHGFEPLNISSIVHGPEVMLAVKANPLNAETLSVSQLIANVNATEAAIKVALPQTDRIFFELDNKD